ncbi:MAG: QueT transporter family protein [Oscillospiraceae bacterium]|nr:QueT transporter family protein [Oscillospiraceae bacterium]
MRKKTRLITHAAVIGAMYFALTHLQNLLLPGSASWSIQCRASEALCVLAFFTPAAIPGLTIGCLLFNLSFAGALPLDFLVGSLATLLACAAMYLTRKLRVFGCPVLGLAMPALWNALLVGWELTVYLGDTGFTMAAFWINALYVAAGEAIVLYTLGLALYRALSRGRLASELFS